VTPEQFMANFGAIAEAPEGIPRLRAKVLSLAATGRLDTQEASDEPAGRLLERIERERSQALGEKKSSKVPRDLSPPFDLPVSWRWATAAQVFVSISDGDHQPPPKTETGIPFLVIGNVSGGAISLKETRYVAKKYYQGLDPVRTPRVRDILYTLVGSYGIAVPVRQGDTPFCIQRHMALLRPPESMDESYLVHLLSSGFMYEQATSVATGTAQKTVPLRGLRRFALPVPPLAEQKRIVAKVDQLMSMLNDLEQRQEKKRSAAVHVSNASLDSLVNAEDPDQLAVAWERVSKNFGVMAGAEGGLERLRDAAMSLCMAGRLGGRSEAAGAELVERAKKRLAVMQSAKRGRNSPLVEPEIREAERLCSVPATWCWTRLGLVTQVSGGVTKGRKLEGRKTTSLPYLRVANVQRWQLDLALMKEIDVPVEEVEKYRVQPGDVLLTEGGDWDKLGRAVVWRGEIETCLHQNHVFRVRGVVDEILPEWIEAWCNFRAGREYFQSCSKQTTNLASVNMRQLRHLPIAIPSAAEQREILSRLRTFGERFAVLRERSDRLQQAASNLAVAATSVASPSQGYR